MATYDNIYEIDSNFDGSALRIGIVMSRFNRDICDGCWAHVPPR
jgi:6,7-dimethyl-8-ribityllumazine synthase (EC 2.5.1.9)